MDPALQEIMNHENTSYEKKFLAAVTSRLPNRQTKKGINPFHQER